MEVGLITLGGLLIIASFEIQFRYLGYAKEYYNNQLKIISEKLDKLLKAKKPLVEENKIQLSTFLEELNELLSDFSDEESKSNFPNHLFLGFFGMGLYIIVLGLISESIIEYVNTTPASDPIWFFVFIFGFLASLPIIQGLISLRKITKIT